MLSAQQRDIVVHMIRRNARVLRRTAAPPTWAHWKNSPPGSGSGSAHPRKTPSSQATWQRSPRFTRTRARSRPPQGRPSSRMGPAPTAPKPGNSRRPPTTGRRKCRSARPGGGNPSRPCSSRSSRATSATPPLPQIRPCGRIWRWPCLSGRNACPSRRFLN